MIHAAITWRTGYLLHWYKNSRFSALQYTNIFCPYWRLFFFIERFADWHEFQIYRPELSNTVIVYQYGNFFGNASLGFAEYMFVWNDKKKIPSSCYENS